MESKTLEVAPAVEKLEYPCLMRCISNASGENYVVLAFGKHEGTVVDREEWATPRIGEHYDDWGDFSKTDIWEPLPKSEVIQLRN